MIKLNKAYKFRLYPNKEQEILINKTIGSARFMYNQLLAERVYSCEQCSLEIDRDYNASINIKRVGMTQLAR